MKNISADQLILYFPPDIWREIAAYLEPEEIANLKLVCKALQKDLSAAALDSIWMPFLNRLHAIDPSISVRAPQGKVQAHFLQAMKKVAQHQNEEVLAFQASSVQDGIKPVTPIEKKLKEIDSIQSAPITLIKLEKTNSLLNEVNAELLDNIIKNQMSITAGALEITSYGSDYYLTRIPTQIFLHPSYQSFWQNLTKLECIGQRIYFIGEGIKICTKLQELDVSKNQLIMLPKALRSLTALEIVKCDNNDLTDLSSIPTTCNGVFAAVNYLTEIPQPLTEKFGEEWTRAQLAMQKRKARKMSIPLLSDESSVDEIEPSFSTVSHPTSYFLDRLRAIDATISISVLDDNLQEKLLYEIKKIVQNQNKEIEHYQSVLNSKIEFDNEWKMIGTADTNILANKLQAILATEGAQITLKEVEEKHRLLNELSAALIANSIKRRSDDDIAKRHFCFYQTGCNVTRFPAAIFLDPEFEAFWKTLLSLDCSNQNLHYISGEIKICVLLLSFDVSSGHLERLPEEIGQCEALASLSCRDNELTLLPDSISKLSKLLRLNCDSNSLNALPNIPDSCIVLTAMFNNLSNIPQTLIDKFGHRWAMDTMQSQKEMPAESMVEEISTEMPAPQAAANDAPMLSVFSNVSTYLVGFLPSFMSSHKRQQKDEDAQEEPRKFKDHKQGA